MNVFNIVFLSVGHSIWLQAELFSNFIQLGCAAVFTCFGRLLSFLIPLMLMNICMNEHIKKNHTFMINLRLLKINEKMKIKNT